MQAQNMTTDFIEKMIRQNSLKYTGLNIHATEFFPKNYLQKRLIVKDINDNNKDDDKKKIINEDEFFDKLEFEFVQQNAWLFE